MSKNDGYEYGEIRIRGNSTIREELLQRITKKLESAECVIWVEKGFLKVKWRDGCDYAICNSEKEILIYPTISETRNAELWNRALEKFFREFIEPITDSTAGISARLVNLPKIGLRPLPIAICLTNDLLRVGMKSLLEKMGGQVVGDAANGQAGFEMILSKRPSLVFLDVNLNGLGGLELCKLVCAELPKLTVVVYTDLASAGRYFHRLKAAGMSALILKSTPWNYWFYALINAHSSRQFWVDPHLGTLIPQSPRLPSEEPGISEFDIQIWIRLQIPDEDIAEEMSIPISVLKDSVRTLFRKLSVSTRAEAIHAGIELGYHFVPESGIDFATGRIKEDLIAEEYAKDISKWW